MEAPIQNNSGGEGNNLQNSRNDKIITILAISALFLLLVSSVGMNLSNNILMKNIEKKLKDKKNEQK